MLYISTDYVFDGSNPPYDVTDETNPLNFYGKSKLDGEKVVLETDPSKINFDLNLFLEVNFSFKLVYFCIKIDYGKILKSYCVNYHQ